MNIVRVEPLSDIRGIVLYFDGGVSKLVKISDACIAVGGDLRAQSARAVIRAVREADRDISYKNHGEEWRNFCEFSSNFWHTSEEEISEVLGEENLGQMKKAVDFLAR